MSVDWKFSATTSTPILTMRVLIKSILGLKSSSHSQGHPHQDRPTSRSQVLLKSRSSQGEGKKWRYLPLISNSPLLMSKSTATIFRNIHFLVEIAVYNFLIIIFNLYMQRFFYWNILWVKEIFYLSNNWYRL